jgi:hypothetical protein
MNGGDKDKVVGVATLAKEEEAAEAVQEKLEEVDGMGEQKLLTENNEDKNEVI